MKIVVLTHTYFPIVGGAEVGIHELYRRMPEDEILVVTPIAADPHDPFAAEDGRDTPFRVRRYTDRTARIRTRFLRDWVRLTAVQEFILLRRLKREFSFDVINVHFVAPFGMIALWARLFLRVPVVTSLIGRSDVVARLSAPMKLHAAVALRLASAVTQISALCLDGSRLASRAVLLPYGADTKTYSPRHRSETLRAWLGAGDERIVLLAVQRLSPVKRVDILFDVMEILEALAPGRYLLVVVGKGSEFQALGERAAVGVLAQCVRMEGFVAEEALPAYFASADIFVSHSEDETFGVVFAQSMASGVPVVAAGTSAIPLVVHDGVDGIVIPPGDRDAFAVKLSDLAGDAVRLRNLGRGARRTSTELYNWDVVASRLRSLLASLV